MDKLYSLMCTYYQKYLIIFFIIFWDFLFPNIIFQDYSVSNLREYELKSILDSNIYPEIYDFSNIPVQSFSKIKSYNFFKKNKNLSFNPVFGLRYSYMGYEINPIGSFSPVIWITPGLQFNYITPIISPYSGFLFHVWGSFYKHSAYFLDKSEINKEFLISQNFKPFEYQPYLSMEYFVKTEKPNWGIDFDESQGGLRILSNNLKLIFGKFKSSYGPFQRGNLSLSLRTPSFPQFKIKYKQLYNNKKYFDFTYFIGDLTSEIADSLLSTAYVNNELEINSRFPWIKRGVVYHRIDLHISKNLRIGLYEQLIYGARQTPWQYLIPINFYWSAQHSIGDFDNLQMGIDLDWIYNNRRTNFAFLIDEWAPFKTLDTENHHNWFAFQIGHTQIFDFIKRKLYFRFESAIISPQIYEHKFPINQAYNQGYPIGYWTKGDAVDIWIVLTSLNEQKISPRIEFEYTILGEPIYEINRKFLNNISSIKQKYSLIMNYKVNIFTNIEFHLSYLKNKNLKYNQKEIYDCILSYKYNISY